MIQRTVAACLFFLSASHYAVLLADQPKLKLMETRKIWDQAPHNAFTDLVRFKQRWFCVFREGQDHVSPDGALRVITSQDAVNWQSAALIQSSDSDLRDAKITVTPSGQLMLAGAEAMHDRSKYSHQSLAWFSEDGHQWSQQQEIGQRDFWLWRVTWHREMAYGIGYACSQGDRSVRLYTSRDGKEFQVLVQPLYDLGYPNETSIVFQDDIAYCLLRRDGQPSDGLLGRAEPPYTQWNWNSVGCKIGGPQMILLPSGQLLAGVRLYDQKVRTSLCWIDKETGKLTEALSLPSGGDSSYPGLVWHDDKLWVSYYSSHDCKTSIYLAQVAIQ